MFSSDIIRIWIEGMGHRAACPDLCYEKIMECERKLLSSGVSGSYYFWVNSHNLCWYVSIQLLENLPKGLLYSVSISDMIIWVRNYKIDSII